MTYKLSGNDPVTGQPVETVINKSNGRQIPKDPDNTDYAEYLEWVAKGNTPEAAD